LRPPVMRAAMVAALLALVGCTAGGHDAIGTAGFWDAPQGLHGGSADAPMPGDAAAQLFAHGLNDIRELYVEPVPVRRLVLSGAAGLAALDNRLGVGEAPGPGGAATLTLGYDHRTIASYAEPAEDASGKWGILVAAMVGAARQASPRLAALPPETLETAVLNGMTATLDRFSRYAAPEVAQDQRAERDGFGGIGVTLDTSDHLLRIAAVSPQGPADRAGIHPEDQIVAINGVAIASGSPEDAIHRLRGPIGSAVALQVRRLGGGAVRELELHRALVTDPTVAMARDGNIALFRIASFNRSTTQRVAAGVAEAQRQGGLAGIVLDLRGDPGGLLDQAVSLADLFLRDGPILATIGRNPASRQYFAASGKAIAPQVPLAVLINGGSASASEIVAAALQDAGRAVVIGSASYGKGTVQTVLRLPNSGELILTWARLVAPAGYLLQQHGVVPTLCTAGLPDDAGGLATMLQRAGEAQHGEAARPRAVLDERGWSELRQSCPPQRTRPAIDVAFAERLLADRELYAAALHPFTAANGVAQNASRLVP
jgi:carboxyl-terminal processing protease